MFSPKGGPFTFPPLLGHLVDRPVAGKARDWRDGDLCREGNGTAPAIMLLREGGDHAVASTSHLAELEIGGTDVVAAWKALEPVVAQCAGLLGTPATKSDYNVGHSDDKGTVARADLRDCLGRVETPTSISVTYTAQSNSSPDPQSIELRIMRYRHFKELNVHIRVTGPSDMQTWGFFERTKSALARAIDRLNEP
jgi:hypothetical protein